MWTNRRHAGDDIGLGWHAVLLSECVILVAPVGCAALYRRLEAVGASPRESALEMGDAL